MEESVPDRQLRDCGGQHQACNKYCAARELLMRLAHQEGSATYWNLEANTTPFYGWGYAGRMETTALAVEALAMLQTLGHDPAEDAQVNRGLQYLLTHKDRYCTWFSTQATQNVIEALIARCRRQMAAPRRTRRQFS